MRDFFQQSDRIYFDECPCADFAPNNDLDKNYFEEFRLSSGLYHSVSTDQIIKNLKLLTSAGKFKNGGVLFFGLHPENYIEKAVIRCVAFEGTNKTQILDDKVYGGAFNESI